FHSTAYLMGILNVTPDSFSDGGQYNSIETAVEKAKEMVADGASIIDVGGESTRPGHISLSDAEEIERVVPVIKALRSQLDIPISIDTSKANVARAALEAGADLVNDVWGFKRDPQLAEVTKEFQVPCCLMHNRENRNYTHFLEEVYSDLEESVRIALDAGISKDRILLDPGIGFAKNLEENLYLMKHLDKLLDLGYPLLLGTSRKSMIGLSLDLPVHERLEGTIATTVLGYQLGCRIFRVHDVKENYRALKMTEIIMKQGE
ncbi:MAG: dihydropteroate synthase, partial [Vallitaleaceae bacterium]|nr:dihydropteroate synthase [Vallitaleaceae bacterium]